MFTVRRIVLGPFALGPADAPIVCALAAVALGTSASCGQLPGWPALLARSLAASAAYAAGLWLVARLGSRPAAQALRAAAVMLAVAYLFGAVAPLQLVLHGRWLDPQVVKLEQALFGIQPTLWLERFIRPWLTEWLMFAYVVYLALYPALCLLLWRRHGEIALEHLLLALTLANVACDLGFVLVPVAGPLPFMGQHYTVALDGWVWTWLAEVIRTNAHYVGGTIPSPHCAAGTVMWGIAWLYHRRWFWALAPLFLSLYVSTVYGRFHYLADAVAGIAVALAALAAAPPLMRTWAALGTRLARKNGRPEGA